jgi:hypothetical protein
MSGKESWTEEQEMTLFRAGQRVELKQRPGVRSTIIGYDPMMVPPVILDNDPQPRYPEELVLLSQPALVFDWFSQRSRRQTAISRVA